MAHIKSSLFTTKSRYCYFYGW